jgi:hypothetical protein
MVSMNKILLVLVSTIAIAIAGCSSTPPVIDYDRSVNFSGYKTYAFISDHPMIRAEGSPPGSPLLEGRLMRLTEDNLNAKGFVLIADPEAADFAVGFTVGARDKIKVNSYPEPYRPYYGGWGWGGAYYGAGYGGSNVDVQQYVEGTLALDIYDVSEHKPAWHGVATKRITDSMRRKPDESLKEFVDEILAGFPPGSMAP